VDRGFKYLPDVSVDSQWLLFANDNELTVARFPGGDGHIPLEFFAILLVYSASICGAVAQLL
jgi:hypothetical protein